MHSNFVFGIKKKWKRKEVIMLFFTILSRFFETAQKSKDELIGLGYPKFTLEDFHDTVSTV